MAIAPAKQAQAHNGLAREQVSSVQRARMLTAMVEEVAQRGAGNVAVAHVVARSGVSRRTFYEVFADRQDCFLAAFEEAVARVAGEVVPAYERPGSWRERIRAGLVAGLSQLDSEPELARLLMVEALGAGPKALERRLSIIDALVTVVDEGRRETNAKQGAGAPALTAEGVVGAVLALLHARWLQHSPERLLELTNPLMSVIVLPYLGPAAARREFDRPAPKAVERHVHDSASDPLRKLGMRLTYRTVRVLMAVAANPGSSNRTIGEGAGMADQGQTSKLLTRLQGLGLVENTGRGSTRGEPNVWTLTNKGWELYGAIGLQTSSS